jgi:16S rRNA (cytosine1402-N4)-methyltransferase
MTDDLPREPAPPARHEPVLVEAVREWLRPRPGAVIVDATIGLGGHALALLPRLLPDGRLLGIDRDAQVLALARQRLREFLPAVILVQGNFVQLAGLLAAAGCPRVDGVLLDLGVSSLQLDQAERGFSFIRPGPLDMRMDPTQGFTAADLLARLSADELEQLLATFGEERFARRIARHLVDVRRRRAVTTTDALARAVVEALPPAARHGRLHAATRTFQALRMAVNEEAVALTQCLDRLGEVLRPGGRAVVISYHSLEDRAVKQTFRRLAQEQGWRLLTKRPISPSAAEIARNPRARSAKLRAIEAP